MDAIDAIFLAEMAGSTTGTALLAFGSLNITDRFAGRT